MCGFGLCSCLRHGNINQTQCLKSYTRLKGTVTNRDMEKYIINVLHIWKTLVPGLRMLGVAHVEYVHYHPVDDIYLAINLGMEGSRLGELGVQ